MTACRDDMAAANQMWQAKRCAGGSLMSSVNDIRATFWQSRRKPNVTSQTLCWGQSYVECE